MTTYIPFDDYHMFLYDNLLGDAASQDHVSNIRSNLTENLDYNLRWFELQSYITENCKAKLVSANGDGKVWWTQSAKNYPRFLQIQSILFQSVQSELQISFRMFCVTAGVICLQQTSHLDHSISEMFLWNFAYVNLTRNNQVNRHTSM